tara:strand:+ start:695 stop:1846 length:1152 start_codon:yes stop_codon:yes gene_type:complete
MVEKFYNNIFLVLYKKNPSLFAIFLVAGGYLFFNITDAIVKAYTENYSFADILFWNSLFNFVSMLIFAQIVGFNKIWRTGKLKWHFLRGVFTFMNCLMAIYAVSELTLANFYAIVFLAPIICVIFGKIFFKDHLTLKKFAAVIFGFIGILIVTKPGAITIGMGVVAAFTLAVCVAMGIMVVRKIGKDEPKLLLSLSNSAVIFAGAIVYAACTGGITLPAMSDLVIFALIGTLASIGGTSVSTGFQIAPSVSTVAPFHYIQIIGGIVLGLIFWNDVPTLTTLIGASIVISSGLWIIRQEKGIRSPIGMTLEEILEQHSVAGRPPLAREAIPQQVWDILTEEQRFQLNQHFENAKKEIERQQKLQKEAEKALNIEHKRKLENALA